MERLLTLKERLGPHQPSHVLSPDRSAAYDTHQPPGPDKPRQRRGLA
jgi:hypothetical protein